MKGIYKAELKEGRRGLTQGEKENIRERKREERKGNKGGREEKIEERLMFQIVAKI